MKLCGGRCQDPAAGRRQGSELGRSVKGKVKGITGCVSVSEMQVWEEIMFDLVGLCKDFVSTLKETEAIRTI